MAETGVGRARVSRVFLFFIDGLGLGPDDPATNPAVTAKLPNLEGLLGGMRPVLRGGRAGTVVAPRAVMVPADATLGVPGLPQSATGQTALFSGVNAPAIIGRHLNAYPNEALCEVLRTKGLLRRAVDRGLTATFLNSFRHTYAELVAAGGRRPSASTMTAVGAGLDLRTLDDLRAGRAVYHDMTNRWLIAQGYEVPVIDPETAGRRAAAIGRDHQVAMYEHFLTDFAGHAQDLDQAVGVLENIDRFLGAFLADYPLDDSLVAVCSDHGNVEDLSVKTHTRNPVPAVFVGAGREEAVGRVRAITDVTPFLMDLIADHREEDPAPE